MLHMKAGLLAALYQKALRISGAARTALGVGKIVNHASTDATRVYDQL